MRRSLRQAMEQRRHTLMSALNVALGADAQVRRQWEDMMSIGCHWGIDDMGDINLIGIAASLSFSSKLQSVFHSIPISGERGHSQTGTGDIWLQRPEIDLSSLMFVMRMVHYFLALSSSLLTFNRWELTRLCLLCQLLEINNKSSLSHPYDHPTI